MSKSRFDLDLTRPTQSGVYVVHADDLDRLEKLAIRDELRVCRTDLAGCPGKDNLMHRLAVSLSLPVTFGFTWDSLADCLRDLSWMPAWGYVLLFDHADDLRQASTADYDTLMGVLDDAATFSEEHERPWFAFLTLPDSVFPSAQAPA
ncbi:barstar family protein [Rhodanobacter sp. AS-Z3]|uniref:barstar family protein n=1 Tax=Rhodanobacter sp. AS-Z3 TaxID=3031330 RepID=UPI002479A176|nr:barstar family protein [Rhodanobacter sp. AS-Z3]WEN13456.1 barstar family protein [Rhodanobacter sp. AS-Z3]